MKQRSDQDQWNKEQIEIHLKSAVDTLTPDIFEKLDLSVPQENGEAVKERQETKKGGVILFLSQMRGAALGAAASLCLLMTGGGVWYYQYENRQIDSVIGIDVNPSVELSINRRERVLKTEALNEDGNQILSDMDLKGVDLNVAVNAVVGSMVTHGYLDDLDNAILVTVSNDSMSRASALRSSVVGNIEKTLEENQVQAVVYDQQAVENDEIEELAKQYKISYGKAYFLKELIESNPDLAMKDMEWLSAITMEELAEWIGKDFPASVEETEVSRETETSAESETEILVPETPEAESPEQTQAPDGEQKESVTEDQNVIVAPSPSEEKAEEDLVEIDYVDYEDDRIFVYFVTYVDWKNPTVLVKDEDGSRYAALVEETAKDECVIFAEGLEGGKNYTFVLGGLRPRGENRASSVTGYFKVPEISEQLEEEEPEESQEEETSSEETEEALGEEGTLPEETEESSEEGEESSEEEGEASGEGSETSGETEGSFEELEESFEEKGKVSGQQKEVSEESRI